MKKITLLIVSILTLSAYTQKNDGICNQSDYFGIPIQEIEYTRYSDKLIKERYTSFSEVKNATPVELVKSMISAKNNEWLSFNYGKKMSWKQEQFDNLNDVNKYVDLLCKLEISIDSQKYAIVKLNLHDSEKKPQYLGLVLKKIANKWIINSDKTLSNLSFLIMFMAIDDIDSIFLQKKSNNEQLNKIINDSWKNDILDLSKINAKVGKMMLNSEYKTKPTVKENEILKNINKTSSIIYNYPLIKQKFCYYFENEIGEYSEQELDLVLGYITNKQVEKTKIISMHKFSYTHNDNNIIILKYYTKIANNKIIKTEQFKVINNIVSVYNSIDDIEKNIFNFIKNLKSDAIIQLSNKDNDEKYNDLNTLKPFIQDFEGVLNIKKINKLLSKPILKKYLDN